MDASAGLFTFSSSDQPPDENNTRRRNAISLEQRRQLRQRYNTDRTQKQRDLAAWFETTFDRAINQSSISDTLSEKYAFLDGVEQDRVLSQTRISRVDFPELEAALYSWQLEREAEGARVTGVQLCEQAQRIWAELPRASGAKDFKASNGWLEGYRKRHGLGKHGLTEGSQTPLRKRQKVVGRLHDRIAIITGSSSGVGRAIAMHFAAEGARVVCSDLQPNLPSSAANASTSESKAPTHLAIQSLYGNASATFVTCNVASESEVKALVDHAVSWGNDRLDIIVNNAGIAAASSGPNRAPRLHETATPDFERLMEVNVKGVFLGCKYALEQFLAQEPRQANDRGDETRGWIINIASTLGHVAFPRTFSYTTSKHAVVGLTKQIAVDYAPDRIHCNALSPGWTDTNMIQRMTSNPTAADFLRSKHPWGQLGQPSDIAKAAVFLASDDASWVTGHTLAVDGGFLAQ